MPNVDADLAGYHIYRADTSKNFTRININVLGRETFRYTDRNNTENTDYFYYLTALDSAGNTSPASKEVYARRVVKLAPQAGNFDLKIKHRNRRKQNQLQWNYNDDAAVMGYVVFRGEQENRLQPITGLIKSKNFTDKKGDNNDKQEKYYQVRAYVGSDVIYSPIIKQKL
jgi:hypothetical protein